MEEKTVVTIGSFSSGEWDKYMEHVREPILEALGGNIVQSYITLKVKEPKEGEPDHAVVINNNSLEFIHAMFGSTPDIENKETLFQMAGGLYVPLMITNLHLDIWFKLNKGKDVYGIKPPEEENITFSLITSKQFAEELGVGREQDPLIIREGWSYNIGKEEWTLISDVFTPSATTEENLAAYTREVLPRETVVACASSPIKPFLDFSKKFSGSKRDEVMDEFLHKMREFADDEEIDLNDPRR